GRLVHRRPRVHPPGPRVRTLRGTGVGTRVAPRPGLWAPALAEHRPRTGRFGRTRGGKGRGRPGPEPHPGRGAPAVARARTPRRTPGRVPARGRPRTRNHTPRARRGTGARARARRVPARPPPGRRAPHRARRAPTGPVAHLHPRPG